MSDYIKREDAISIIRRRCKKHTTICVATVTELQELPPADVRENVKGHWIDKSQGVWVVKQCSACNGICDYQFNFCPYCGAEMGDKNE